MSAWTSRVVEFDPNPAHKGAPEGSEWDQMFDALAEHYYAARRPCQTLISACNGVMRVNGFPWWLPKWWARRTVCTIAERCGVGGTASYLVERDVLIDTPDEPAP